MTIQTGRMIRNAPGTTAARHGAQSRIELVNPLARVDWDDWIRGHPEASFFHGAAWAEVLQVACGAQPFYLVAGLDQVELLAVMEVRSPLTGLRGVSLPFTDLCPPLVCEERKGVPGQAEAGPSDPECSAAEPAPGALSTGNATQRLLQRALELGRERGWRSWECRGGVHLPGATPSLAYFEHSLDLRPGEQALFSGFDSTVRRAIRKAQRTGLRTEILTSGEAMRAFYRLYCQTRRRHGVPPQPWRFFECISEYVLRRNQGFVVLARHDETPIAGAVFFHLGDRALFKYGGSDHRFEELRGNNLVMWTAIRWLAAHGFKSLHFGRTSLANEGLRRFKQNWGAAERRLEYVKFDFRAGRFVADQDRAHGWHTGMFRRLPVPVLRLMGAVLYPHLT